MQMSFLKFIFKYYCNISSYSILENFLKEQFFEPTENFYPLTFLKFWSECGIRQHLEAFKAFELNMILEAFRCSIKLNSYLNFYTNLGQDSTD